MKTLQGHTKRVHETVFLPDGSLASCSEDEKIKMWSLNSDEEICELTGHNECVYSICLLSNDLLASGSRDKTIKIWNWKKRTLVKTLEGHTKSVLSVRSIRNDRLASYSADDTIKIWNPYFDNENLLMTMSGHGTKTYPLPLGVLSNNHLVTCSHIASENAILKVWNPNDGKLIKTIKTQFKNARTLYVLENDQVAVGYDGGTINIIDLEDEEKSKTFETLHDTYVSAMLQLPNGDLVSAGGHGEAIKIWSSEDGRGSPLQSISFRECWIFSISISPDEKRLALASDDFSVYILPCDHN